MEGGKGVKRGVGDADSEGVHGNTYTGVGRMRTKLKAQQLNNPLSMIQ